MIMTVMVIINDYDDNKGGDCYNDDNNDNDNYNDKLGHSLGIFV